MLDANFAKLSDNTEKRNAQKLKQDAITLASANVYCKIKQRKSRARISIMEM